MTAGIQSGFVLYAGTSNDSPMVGYSITDTLDIANIPPAAAEFIARYKEATAGGKDSRAKHVDQDSPTYPLPTIDPVAPFIKTKWGQGAPFNGKCPLYQGSRSVTGCDAVAVGQVLHYYKARNFNDFTLEYADERSLEEVSVNFSRYNFDYDNMLDVYEPGNYSQTQADAVAEMMYVTGAACKTKWSTGQSSGQWPVVAFDKFFNLNANYLYRDGLPTGYWMHKIQENLSAGKPILYTGTGVSNSAYSAHIFVLDGIDSDNYVHVNWGWAGQADGYYDITFCHPDFFGDNEDGYYMKQMMICDIEPRKNGEKYHEKYIATASTKMSPYNDNNSITGSVIAVTTNSYEPSKYGSRLILRKSGGSSSPDHLFGTASQGAHFPSWGYLKWDLRLKLTVMEDGEWEFMLQTVNIDTEEVVTTEPVPMRPYIAVAGNSITGYGYKDYPEGKCSLLDVTEYLSFDSFTPVTDVIAKTPFFAKVKTKSLLTVLEGDDIKSVHLSFTNIETGKTYITQNSIVLYDLRYSGLDYERVVKIEPPLNPDNNFTMPAGHYKIEVLNSNTSSTPDSRVVYPEPLYIDVAPAVDYPILQYDMSGTLMLGNWHYGQDYNKKWSDNIAVRINQYYKGFAPVNNNFNPVDMMLYAREAENPEAEEIMISSFVFDPTKHFSAYSTYIPGNLYPLQGEYIFYFRYLTPDGERDILPLTWDHIDKETGLPATPTPHFISADYNAGLPMIEVSSIAMDGDKLIMTVKNIATSQFNGQIYSQIYDMQHGDIGSIASDQLTLAPGGSRQLILNVDIRIDTAYEVYVRSIATTTRGATDSPTLATKPDGSIAHYQLTRNSDSGIESIAPDADRIEIVSKPGKIIIMNAPAGSTARVYTLNGNLVRETTKSEITDMTPGLYVVRILDTSRKILVR